MTLKRTPIYEAYRNQAKTIDFGGWDLPVQFSSIKAEHEAVRTAAGLFDVSHMGEILVEGPGSRHYLQTMLTNDLDKLEPNKAQYTIMCYENGGTVDDLIVYMLAEDTYLLVVNASNTDKDFEWLKRHETEEVQITNCSAEYAQVALQGPKAEAVLQKLTDTDLSEVSFFRFQYPVKIGTLQSDFLVSRTGYTGEDGFEIYGDTQEAEALWQLLLENGESEGLVPVGLGARDTLRFEANLALYGNELTPDISPIEAGLGFAVNTDKAVDFIGKAALQEQKKQAARKLVGIEMTDKGIPRHGYKIYKDEQEIGVVTTGTQSPTLGKNVGLALIDKQYAEAAGELLVEVRSRKLKAKIVPTPFYKRKA